MYLNTVLTKVFAIVFGKFIVFVFVFKTMQCIWTQVWLQQFWDIESIGISEDSTLEDSGFSHIILLDSTQNRYCAALSWNSLHLHSTNYELYLTRLHYLRNRLQKNGSLLQEYQSTFDEQLKSGIIEVVPKSEEIIQNCFFLPHHGVIRQDKDTTKLRIVFDGSAKADNNVSLNDCLSKGPNHTPLILDILLRFRFYKIALIASIEKAFHQILINPSDRDMLRFLWFKNTDAGQMKILQYRFCQLPFGLKPSPAILNAVLQKHFAEYNTSEREMYTSCCLNHFMWMILLVVLLVTRRVSRCIKLQTKF